MRSKLIVAAAILGLAVAGPAAASADLAKSAGCLNCHNVEGAKKMGASLKDLGAKAKGANTKAEDLAAKITGGKGHPASKASPADVKKVVDWMLTL